jgi:hypothetical protein
MDRANGRCRTVPTSGKNDKLSFELLPHLTRFLLRAFLACFFFRVRAAFLADADFAALARVADAFPSFVPPLSWPGLRSLPYLGPNRFYLSVYFDLSPLGMMLLHAWDFNVGYDRWGVTIDYSEDNGLQQM